MGGWNPLQPSTIERDHHPINDKIKNKVYYCNTINVQRNNQIFEVFDINDDIYGYSDKILFN